MINLKFGTQSFFKRGHEDWVQALDACLDPNDDDVILASGSQDNFVRIWRFKDVGEEIVYAEKRRHSEPKLPKNSSFF